MSRNHRGKKPTPLIEEPRAWDYTAGLYNEGGSAFIIRQKGRPPRPRTEIKMCSRESLEPAARVWNVEIRQKKKRSCKPQNPEGRPYFIQKQGAGACLVAERLKQTGYLSPEKEEQFKRAGCIF